MKYAILSIISHLKGLPFNYIFLGVKIFCLLFNTFLFLRVKSGKIDQSQSKPFYFLMLILASSIFIDISMILYYLHCEPFGYVSPLLSRFVNRLDAIAWVVQFYAFIPFFRELSSQKISKRAPVLFSVPVVLFALGYFTRALQVFFSGNPEYLSIDEFMDKCAGYYILSCIIASLFIVYRNYKKDSIEIIKGQNYIFGIYFVLPYLLEKLFIMGFSLFDFDMAFSHQMGTFSCLFVTVMLGYSFSKLFGIRFLNTADHVAAPSCKRFKFMDDFKYILAQFPKAQEGNELAAITKEFFELAFKVPRHKVHLLLKGKLYNRDENESDINAMRRMHLDELLKPENDSTGISRLFKKKRILITDEVEFSNFYEPVLANSPFKKILQFLKQGDVDLVLPIFCGGKFSGAIVIDRHCRDKKFFTDVERDQMLLFNDYLSSVVYMLLHNDVEGIVEENQHFKRGIYRNEKLLRNLRKSMGTFLENGTTESVGVLVYKNKKFLYCNKDAHELIRVDLNKDKGLEITKEITRVASESAKFFTEQKVIIEDPEGQKLVVKVAPNVEKNNTILTITKPNVADIIRADCAFLRSKSQWDSLLALRTTEEGAYINKLIPADTRELLNLKVSFLEKAMTRKALLFELAEEDAKAFAHVAHKINDRSAIEELDVANNEGLARKLFGANKEEAEQCLLKKLDKNGTLLLQNVHVLDMELQKKFYEFVTSGAYNSMQGDDKFHSDVLVIFSSNQNLRKLVEKGIFLPELYHALALGEVTLPSFSLMEKEEVLALAEGLRQKLVANKLYSNILVLNDADKKKILESNCVSLHELSKKVKHLVLLKTKKQSIKSTRAMDPAYGIADFELMAVARLGKNALKDPRAMELLMGKFNGNRNKMAEFLGVNRSSVCRRVEQYGLDKSIRYKQKR